MPRDDFDVIVIGSGAGGSPIAYTAACKHKHVLVLEKGPLLRPEDEVPGRRTPSDFKRDELFATGPEKRLTLAVGNQGSGMFNSHVEPDLNDEPHIYRRPDGTDHATIEGYTAQVVGGGTQLYGGVSLRFTELDLKLQSFNAGRSLPGDPTGDVAKESRDWPIKYKVLEEYYCKVEKLIGINGEQANQAKPFSQPDTYQKPLTPNGVSQYALLGMTSLGMKAYRTPLAVITEDHPPSGRTVPRDAAGKADPEAARTGYVNRYGCPLGLKSNTYVTLLRPTLRDPATAPYLDLRANCVVTHLTQQNGKVDGVWYRDPSGKAVKVTAKTVVVACSAIESVRLLLLSAEHDPAFADRLHNKRTAEDSLVGKYFLTHCFGGAEGDTPQPADKSISLDSDYATDFCALDSFLRSEKLWAGGAIYNNTSDQALPISLGRTHGSQDLDTIWQEYVRRADITGEGFLKWLRENFQRSLSVSFMANQVPMKQNRIDLHAVTDKWYRKVAYIRKGWHPHDVHVMTRLAAVCRDVLAGGGVAVQGFGHVGDDARARIANHVLGGLRFGDKDATDSVLDATCRHWNFDNLYVTDGSFMPTSGGANPTLTIQANAFRVADLLPL